MPNEQPGYNLKNFVYSPITIAPTTGYITYGTVVALPGARTLARNPSILKGEMWGDGVKMVDMIKRGPTTLDLEVIGLDLETEAVLFGETQDGTTKQVEEAEDDTPQLCALGYKEELADGREKVYWEYWGYFEPTSEEYQTFQGEVALRARKLRYNGMARPCDKKFRRKMDEDSLPAGEDLDDFFTATTLMATVPVGFKAA